MGWDNCKPPDFAMTSAQGRMIISLREQYDGRRPGEYAEDVLPKWTKFEANLEIEKLRIRIKNKSLAQRGHPNVKGKDL